MDWRRFFFGPWGRQSDQQPAQGAPITPSAGNGGSEEIYAHAPERELRSSEQHKRLFDDGVLHWNQHRHQDDFRPHFAGMNFPKEAAKSRLWGKPHDLVGDERIVLSGINLNYADLQGCVLTRADMRDCKLIGANLRNANLTGANLSNADLTDCDMRGAVLDRAIFARSKLTRANMSGASLKGTNFAWADLSHAILGARNAEGASFFGATREGVVTRRDPEPVQGPIKL